MRKITAAIIATLICLTMLCACSGAQNDPLKLAEHFDEKDYYVSVGVDDSEIKDLADSFEVRAKGIQCAVIVVPDDDDDYEKMGVFFFCKDNDSAKTLEEDLDEFLDGNDEAKEGIDRCIVERKGKLVFCGCEDAWEDMK